jgi:hypothetical protein
VYQIAASLFFTLILAGSLFAIGFMLREYRDEIIAALKGEMPRRRAERPWTRQVRVTVQPRPAPALAMPRRRVAA